MSLTLREAELEDIPSMFEIRTLVEENSMTLEELECEGITPESVKEALCGSCRGWVVDLNEFVVGFSIANSATRSVWAIFIHPNHEGKGGGRLLLEAATDWLRNQGVGIIRLTTGVNTRAEGFYSHMGWSRGTTTSDGEIEFTLQSPEASADSC